MYLYLYLYALLCIFICICIFITPPPPPFYSNCCCQSIQPHNDLIENLRTKEKKIIMGNLSFVSLFALTEQKIHQREKNSKKVSFSSSNHVKLCLLRNFALINQRSVATQRRWHPKAESTINPKRTGTQEFARRICTNGTAQCTQRFFPQSWWARGQSRFCVRLFFFSSTQTMMLKPYLLPISVELDRVSRRDHILMIPFERSEISQLLLCSWWFTKNQNISRRIQIRGTGERVWFWKRRLICRALRLYGWNRT